MNSRARKSLEQIKQIPSEAEHTAHISNETISRLKAECVAEPSELTDPGAPSSPRVSSLSGMVAPAPFGAQPNQPFTTVCELASGSTAMVYLAVNSRAQGPDQVVAIKHYSPRLMQKREFAEQFIQEMSVARAVEHPCVCKVFDYGQAGDSFYTAMEFLEGEPLSKVLTASNLLKPELRSPRIIAHVIAQLAQGLHALHTLPTKDGPLEAVHRDVTASNLFVLFDGSLRITNIGTAWIRDLVGQKQGALDRSYLAPEQLGRGVLDARVDVWALGVVLWELLAGQKLFRCTTQREAAVQITARRIAPPSEHHPQVTAELDRIVLKALARNPAKRHASTQELSADLEQYLAQTGGPIEKSAIGEWLTQLFPSGTERVRAMLELAHARAPASFPRPRHE